MKAQTGIDLPPNDDWGHDTTTRSDGGHGSSMAGGCERYKEREPDNAYECAVFVLHGSRVVCVGWMKMSGKNCYRDGVEGWKGKLLEP